MPHSVHRLTRSRLEKPNQGVLPSRAIGNDVLPARLFRSSIAKHVAPNCPQPCRSAAARVSSGEHRSVVQMLKAAAIQPGVSSSIQSRPNWPTTRMTIRRSTSQRPRMLYHRGGARSLIATHRSGRLAALDHALRRAWEYRAPPAPALCRRRVHLSLLAAFLLTCIAKCRGCGKAQCRIRTNVGVASVL